MQQVQAAAILVCLAASAVRIGNAADTPHEQRWSVVAPQQEPVQGTLEFPSVRYAHGAVSWKGSLVVTHGYFHDHAARTPTWKSDTWRLTTSGQWELLVADDEDAPGGRMSFSTVLWRNWLVMYGGSRGGQMTAHGYVGHTNSEIWALDLDELLWVSLTPATGAQQPPSRELHAAVVVGDNSMFVHGGVDRADLWVFHLERQVWSELVLSGSARGAAESPGQRFGHAVCARDERGFYLHGGHSRFPVVSHNDLWYFDVVRTRWTQLSSLGDEKSGAAQAFAAPPFLVHHAHTLMPDRRSWILFGGSHSHACTDKLFLLDLDTLEWSELAAEARPFARYHHSMVFNGSHVVVFGGESMSPYMYHNAVAAFPILASLSASSSDNAAVGSNLTDGAIPLAQVQQHRRPAWADAARAARGRGQLRRVIDKSPYARRGLLLAGAALVLLLICSRTLRKRVCAARLGQLAGVALILPVAIFVLIYFY
eukprot:m.14344 g.14344  ORF g.14344 m.14344 type:complete len:481 (-) comp3362_c0_seq1:39-1481(-)